MAKDWDKARALFEAFTQEEKSFRDIEKESGVPVSLLRDRAKKEGWAERQEQLARDVAIRIRQAAIKKERRSHCVDCGSKIPAERLKAVNAIR